MFLSADVSPNGTVMVGSDLSGVYYRAHNVTTWSRAGYFQGITATRIACVRWNPKSNLIALAGTAGGLYRTVDGGSSWFRIGTSATFWLDRNIRAIGWCLQDTSIVYLTVQGTGSDDQLWKSTNGGVSWTQVTTDLTGSEWLKVQPVGNGSDVWVYSGDTFGTLWRSINSGANFSQRTGTYSSIIDFAVSDSIAAGCAVVAELYAAHSDTTRGQIELFKADGSSSTLSTNHVTGGVYLNGGNAYAVNLRESPASGNGNQFKGVYKITNETADWSAATNITFTRINSGASWEIGWTTATRAYGASERQACHSLSARGEYWVTSSYAWRLKDNAGNSGPFNQGSDYTNAFSDDNSAPFHSIGLDNVNVIAIAPGDDASECYVGYDDLGVWRTTDAGLTMSQRNPTSGHMHSGYGASISALMFLGEGGSGDTLYAAIGKSSDIDTTISSIEYHNYFLWRSFDSGVTWQSGKDFNTSNVLPVGWVYGLCYDRPRGTMWVTSRGRAYKSTDLGANWSPVSDEELPTDGIYIMAAYDGTVYAGGWAGLYVSTDNGANFSKITSPDLDFTNEKGNVGDSNGGGSYDDLNQVGWNGPHTIFIAQGSGEVWVASYLTPGTSAGNPKGLYRGSLGGASLTNVINRKVVRGVCVDSCDMRVQVTSGEALTNGTNTPADLDLGYGREIYRLSGTAPGGWYASWKPNQVDYVYPLGGDAIRSDQQGYTYLSTPGFGLHVSALANEGECETQFGGGGGGQAVLGEVAATLSLQYNDKWFSVSAGGRLQVFDLLGRQVADLRAERDGQIPWNAKPGVYFALFRSGGREASMRFVVLR